MSLTTIQQIQEAIKNSNNVLITFKKIHSGDAVSSALALALILKKLRKQVDIICDNFVLPPKYNFLPSTSEIQTQNSPLRKFIISLDISKTKIDEFSYDIAENKLNIFITPKSGYFNQSDVTTSSSEFKYDLIFVLDTSDLEMLGTIYDKNTEFFYNTPLINIDHEAENEHFGQINLVDLTATSTAEIIFDIFEKTAPETIDENIATCLLTGLISETKSFKSPQITPKSLNTVSKLIAVGARREQIIQNLYQTKSINTLKLWGKILSNINHDSNLNLVWSTIKNQDFHQTGTNENFLPEIFDDLMGSSPEAQIVTLIYENDKNIKSIIYTDKKINALNLTRTFKPVGSKNYAQLTLENIGLADAEQKIVNEIKKNLKTNNITTV